VSYEVLEYDAESNIFLMKDGFLEDLRRKPNSTHQLHIFLFVARHDKDHAARMKKAKAEEIAMKELVDILEKGDALIIVLSIEFKRITQRKRMGLGVIMVVIEKVGHYLRA
jgi:hypothetical protein